MEEFWRNDVIITRYIIPEGSLSTEESSETMAFGDWIFLERYFTRTQTLYTLWISKCTGVVLQLADHIILTANSVYVSFNLLDNGMSRIQFLNQVHVHSQPMGGQLWTHAWFTEIGIWKCVCTYLCMFLRMYPREWKLKGVKNLCVRNKVCLQLDFALRQLLISVLKYGYL